MVKNIIFDIGDVLADFVWREFYGTFGFSDEIQEKLAACTVLGPLWPEFDQGVLGEQEMIAAFKQYDDTIAAEIDMVFHDIGGMLRQKDYAVPWINELKEQGYKVYIISNMPSQMARQCADALSFAELADGVILSFQEKMAKPDSTIFRRLLERYDLTAGECVFIDDRERNVTAARNLGIPGIVFESYQQAYGDLKKLLMM